MRRFFSESERQMLYRAAKGKCEICGIDLHGVFEADHIKPYARGGKTDIANGQVLCKGCNMKKTDFYPLPDWNIELRPWQHQAMTSYWAKAAKDFLLVATPGAGKTIFCLRVAYQLISDGVVDRVAVIVPSDNLKTQWAIEAAQVGINLQKVYDADIDLASDMDGIVTTYQAVGMRRDTAKSLRLYTRRQRTFVIFDEIHHAGDGLTWGSGIRDAFEYAERRLSVTGTPFRSDRNEIPFIQYESAGEHQVSRPDFVYGYGAALRDGVVRPVFFQTYDGDLTWLSGSETITATFGDELGPGRARERLNAAISPSGDWLHQVLVDAHKKLMLIRASHPSAGGLVIAKDIYHARRIADKLREISSTVVEIATSDDDESSGVIDRFRDGNSEWIVAVKMVSEGVDIRRLRVGVYATNITTELFFRQAVGRIVRVIEGIEEQDAWFFIPRDPTIVGYAEALKEERNHVIEDDQDDLLEENSVPSSADDNEMTERLFETVISQAILGDVIHDAASFSTEELEHARQLAAALDMPTLNPVMIAKIVRHLSNGHTPPVSKPTRTESRIPTLEQRKAAYRKRGGVIAKATMRLIEASNGRLDHQAINRSLNHAQDVERIQQCTMEQLQQRVEILKAWRGAYDNDTWREFTPKRYLREHAG